MLQGEAESMRNHILIWWRSLRKNHSVSGSWIDEKLYSHLVD